MYLSGRTQASAFSALRRRVGRLVTSNYDIADRCNLRCEGCLFFAGDDYKQYRVNEDAACWDAFFRAERERGVNFGYFAGVRACVESQSRIARDFLRSRARSSLS